MACGVAYNVFKMNMGWRIFNKGYCGQLIFVLLTHE